MTRSTYQLRISLSRAVTTLCFAALYLIATSARLSAQAPTGVSIDVIELWIKGRVSPQRIWTREVRDAGLAFTMDAATETRFRSIGATDEMITMLKGARVSVPIAAQPVQPALPTQLPRPTSATQGLPSPPPQPLPAPVPVARHRYTRAELKPLYFGRTTTVTPYVSVAQLKESGGAVIGQRTQTLRGTVALRNAPISPSAVLYGLVINYESFGLDLEAYFHQPDFSMVHLGAAYDAFLPLGNSGLRVIAGVTPMIGGTKQVLGHVPRAQGDTTNNDIDIVNLTYGGDARGGLAYHWRPGSWIFAEYHYRYEATMSRTFSVPGKPDVVDGIPWSKWGARGGMLRVGFGF